ncbi:MAG: hypothetical protein RMK29_21220 [Myxococcales bacterium]|nr:hypothetical protein [Myxococcota bacterium]MDW8284232.1 hypothetical protein [Myxococcales bacterium]
MLVRSVGILCLVGTLFPHVAAAQQCALRYTESFARLPSLGLRNLSQAQAISEVNNLFGPRPDVCEPGGYKVFLDAFTDYAREALRAPVRTRDGMIRVAIAAVQQGPLRVPFEESKTAVTLFRQTRSNIHAIADDVGITPLMQQLLDALERSGPPATTAPPPPPPSPAPGSPGAPSVQQVRVPQVPLPPWAVISLYEIRDALNSKNTGVALGKLEAILKWMETAQ